MRGRRPDRPDDLEVVRAVLARQRRLGSSFEDAWALALAAVGDRGVESMAEEVDREHALVALRATEEAWCRGYERLPPPEPNHRMLPLDVLAGAA